MRSLAIFTLLSAFTPSLTNAGGPATQGKPGLYQCTQSECGDYACVPTGQNLTCVNAMPNGYDMEYNGKYMRCDALGSQGAGALLSCTCTIDYLDCADGGGNSGSGSADNKNGAAKHQQGRVLVAASVAVLSSALLHCSW